MGLRREAAFFVLAFKRPAGMKFSLLHLGGIKRAKKRALHPATGNFRLFVRTRRPASVCPLPRRFWRRPHQLTGRPGFSLPLQGKTTRAFRFLGAACQDNADMSIRGFREEVLHEFQAFGQRGRRIRAIYPPTLISTRVRSLVFLQSGERELNRLLAGGLPGVWFGLRAHGESCCNLLVNHNLPLHLCGGIFYFFR